MFGAFLLLVAQASPPAPAPVPEYRFSAEASGAEIVLGETGQLRIAIEPRADKKLNLKSPFAIELEADGAQVQPSRLGAADAVMENGRAALQASYQGARPGPATLTVRARFFICDERVCERRSEQRTLTLTVRDARGGS